MKDLTQRCFKSNPTPTLSPTLTNKFFSGARAGAEPATGFFPFQKNLSLSKETSLACKFGKDLECHANLYLGFRCRCWYQISRPTHNHTTTQTFKKKRNGSR